ncbi:Heat shock factor-binding protein 1 [Lobulomyces angularis]|nr:Heat shock factor-binding protein 1 [Lobulomyces angularis]
MADKNNNNTNPETPQELTAFIETVIKQLQSKFEDMSTQIVSKSKFEVDDMGSRIDELEKSIGDLLQQTSADSTDNELEPNTKDPGN